MKRIPVIIGIALIGLMLSAFSWANGIDEIKRALQKGDVSLLSKYIGENVEIEIDGHADYYTKAEAIAKLKAFFAGNQVTGFTQAHQGSTKDSSAKFVIGHLMTQSGKYRVYLLTKIKNNRPVIRELNFSKE